MADLRQVKTRLATAHTALEAGANILHDVGIINGESALAYVERELHKILGRLEALDAGLSNMIPPKRKAVRGGNVQDS